MKTLFKTLLLVFITSASGYAQRHRIIDKSFEVDRNTSIVINLDNIVVAIEESTDGKVHFDYVMEFDGFSKKKIQEFIDNIEVNVDNSDNRVTLTAASKSMVDSEIIIFDPPRGITITDVYFKPKIDSIIRKTKDFLIKEIRLNNRTRLKDPLKFVTGRFKMVKENGKLTNFTKGSSNLLRSEFVIKLPPFVKLTMNSKNSSIFFRNDMQNELSITSKQGSLKLKSLENKYNKIKIDDASFEAESIIGGDYTLKNVKTGKIGSIQNVKIISEFSKIEIGEIDKESTITDFNSEYWFYNWSDDFNRFNLYSEYSKIHLFYPKANHSMKVIGNNTKHIIREKFTTELQPTSKSEKYTMMIKDAKPDKAITGDIFFDIVHGIIYAH
jgi:hypothetical protein